MRPTISRYINIEVFSRTEGKPPTNTYASSIKRLIMPEDMDIFRLTISTHYLYNGISPITSYRIRRNTTQIPTAFGMLSISDSPQLNFTDGLILSDKLSAMFVDPADPTFTYDNIVTHPPPWFWIEEVRTVI